MKKVAFHTLGCKVNYYETEAVWGLFETAGYDRAEFKDRADVYVINSCTVTNGGDKKSRQIIRRAIRKNPEAVVCVMGCMAQTQPKEVAAIPGVDIVIGTSGRSDILRLIERYERERLPINAVLDNIFKEKKFETLNVTHFENRKRAALKIQDGCNKFCTFCIIPWARGRVRSEQPEIVLQQARNLVASGHIELVLTGIHTAAYGEDLEHYKLSDLLRDLCAIEGLKRIRISSIEASQMTDDVIDVMLTHSEVIAEHIHVPIQAGSNDILKAMRRTYVLDEYEAKIEKLRAIFPRMSITTDIIVGFPGETEENFLESVETVKRIGFAELHVFPYSLRNGTKAATMPNHVSEITKTMRVSAMIAVNEQLAKEYASQFEGDVLEVIVEKIKDGYAIGHASNYLHLKCPVPADFDEAVVQMKVTKAGYPLCEGALAWPHPVNETVGWTAGQFAKGV
ncbi:MAG: tRNA (N(6)-L-threonylcarbamoyladenosine(37)-C(2))-methylthiotransferase MtaB [Defluviitaleaceae bacterium]|nr:tRNA (N(6)-L-threonylcarbamoyladenosine(37)-C(2))-methylthiotransferase MtaB [Defluviitaleaceae bacterium]